MLCRQGRTKGRQRVTMVQNFNSINSLLRFDGALSEPQVYRPPAEKILGGDPLQSAWNIFSSADQKFHSGIWECQPGKWQVNFTESEFCQLT